MKAHSSKVGVFVRIRPTADFSRDVVECLPDGQTVNIHPRKDSRRPRDTRKSQLSYWSFRLEGVLQDVSQEESYGRVCRQVVLGALDGYNGTVMCFGQTGAGKTYTMTGSTESYKQRGIIPRALQEVFREVERRTENSFSVHLSYLQIYNETLVDLLSSLRGSPRPSPRGMVVMEEPGGGVFIRGLSLHPVHSEEEALNLLFEGGLNHIIGSHALNNNSSRSHCIFTVHIESRSRTLSDAKYVTSKLNLVDLAGSERVGKTGSEGQMFKEAMYINKSLSFLEQAILALADRRRDHVPFRQTKLTHALKDSLGGNCNTVLVANIYGEAAQMEETLSTLRFASRMKCVQTNPAVNEHNDPAAQIQKLKKDVLMLKEELSICNTQANRPSIGYEPLSEAQLAEVHSQVQRYLEGSLEEISIVSTRQVQAAFAQFKLAVQERGQKVKAQQCQTYNLVEKNQSVNKAAIKELGSRGSTDHVVVGSFAASPSQKNTQRPSSSETTTSQDTPSSTRPKAEAFEDFKVGHGSQITRILKENTAVLLERRSLLRQLSEEVNAVKRKMDDTAASMLQQQEERGGRGQSLVAEEPDASSLMQLRELKVLYRQRYEALRDIKAEVNYCQHLVDQCRVRLLSEFEMWYKKSSPVPEELDRTMQKTLEQRKDSQRSSEQLLEEELLPDNACNAEKEEFPGADLHSGAEEVARTEKTSSNSSC